MLLIIGLLLYFGGKWLNNAIEQKAAWDAAATCNVAEEFIQVEVLYVRAQRLGP